MASQNPMEDGSPLQLVHEEEKEMERCGEETSVNSWGWVDGWSIQTAALEWSEQLQAGCRQLQKSAQRIDVKAPLAELGGDIVDFYDAVGRSVASPIMELSEDVLAEIRRCTDSAVSSLEIQRGHVASLWQERWNCNTLALEKSMLKFDIAEHGEDNRSTLPLMLAGLAIKTPSGMIVMASVGPAFSLKAACVFVGASMLMKCWVTATRSTADDSEKIRVQRRLAIAVTGICGVVNLGIAFGGLATLLKLGGMSTALLHRYVAHPNLFVHYLADTAVNPLLLFGIGQCSAEGSARPVSMTESMLVSSLGAGFMVASSLVMSPMSVGLCGAGGVCCIIFQNCELQSAFPVTPKSRGRQVADAYIFAQSLYVVPTMLAILLPSPSVEAAIPIIDLFGKMGVVQLSQNVAYGKTQTAADSQPPT